MGKKSKIKIIAAATAICVSGTSCSSSNENDSTDMEKKSLIEKLKSLVGRKGRDVVPAMAMCYDMPAQPEEEYECPVCGQTYQIWGYQWSDFKNRVDQLIEKGYDVRCGMACVKCENLDASKFETGVAYVLFYKPNKDDKEYTKAYLNFAYEIDEVLGIKEDSTADMKDDSTSE